MIDPTANSYLLTPAVSDEGNWMKQVMSDLVIHARSRYESEPVFKEVQLLREKGKI